MPLQGLDLSKKRGCKRRFAPETVISRIPAQAQLHVAHPRFKGPSEDA